MSSPASWPTLTEVSTSSLERMVEGFEHGWLKAPLTRSSLIAFGVSSQLEELAAVLSGHSQSACLAILRSVLAERSRRTRKAPELVWTGPEGMRAQARDTAIVLRELFESARSRVVLAGYSFENSESVLRPLERVMVEHGVRAHFFVNVEQPSDPEPDEEARGRRQLEEFLRRNWPFSSPPPAVYCDRRALRPGYGGEFCSLHAKCVSIDSKRAFVSSANFTMRGQERNIETGVLVDDPEFALQLERQWISLIEGGFVFGINGRL